jgi:hypothetical protein
MKAICSVTQRHYAMTGTVMQHNQSVDSMIDKMPLWIPQHLAIQVASIDPSGVADSSLLQGITQNANDA